MYDLVPGMSDFLAAILLNAIYFGLILVAVSGVLSGILFLPIWGFNERRAAIGFRALQLTGIGLLVIILALPMRTAVLHFFPVPTSVPVPLIPGITPTPGT